MTNKRKFRISLSLVVVVFAAALAIGVFNSAPTSIERTMYSVLTLSCFIAALYFKRPEKIRF